MLYYGILAHEILSGKRISEDLSELPKIGECSPSCYITQLVDKIQKGKMDMQFPGDKTAFTESLSRCFDPEARKRPTFKEILFAIEKAE